MNQSSLRLPFVQLARDLRPDRLLPSLSTGLVTGLLSAIFAISFAALIFSGELAELLPMGIGLVLLGNVVLIAVVGMLSSHPSTIAISQDAPAGILAPAVLALLAAMPAAPAAQKFATAIVFIVSATVLAGVFFTLLGYFKMGGLVRFLPYPVIGGFLAGTGWLILAGAIGLMADRDLGPELLQPGLLLRWLPGLLLGVIAISLSARSSNPLLIPGLLLAALALFYLVLPLTGASAAEARAQGWLLAEFPAGGLWQFPLAAGALAQTDWPVLLRSLPGLAPMVLIAVVVMLLNTSGVEIFVKQDLDLNRELVMAGVGNMASGLVGGIPGFHTIGLARLNHRLSGSSRLTGLATAGVCGLALLVGPLVLGYVPKLILGGMLSFLGLSFIVDWAIQARRQFPPLEYFIVLLILGVVAVFGFLEGVGVGLFATVVLFVINYSRINVVRNTLSGSSFQSRVTRAVHLREALRARGDLIHILQLQGYLFFGTAHRLLEQVRARLAQTDLAPPRFVILDFRQVTGLDSTALLSFIKMRQSVQERGATLIFTHLSPSLMRQFSGSGLAEAQGGVAFFPDLDHGVEWCEAEILRAEGVSEAAGSLKHQIEALLDGSGAVEALLRHLDRQELPPGGYLFRQDDAPDRIYLVEDGQVTAQLEPPDGGQPIRLETMRGGRVVGEIGFYLGIRRTAAVRVDEPSTVYCLSQDQLKKMERADPEAASTFHRVIVHLLAERATHLIRAVDALRK